MTAAVIRRLLAEFTGTGLLVAVVVGAGIAVTRLTTPLAVVAAWGVVSFGIALKIFRWR